MEANNEVNNKKTKIIINTIVILLIVIGIIGVSYAYFTAQLQGNETGTTLTVGAGTMNISFSGGNNITVSNIIPGPGVAASKTFTVTGNNTTDLNMPYALSLVVDSNTFSSNAISYTLTSVNTSGSGTIVPEITESQSVAIVSGTYPLGNGNFIEGTGKIHTYVLNIYFLDTGGDQNADQGKTFRAHVGINGEESIAAVDPANLTIDITEGMIPVSYNTLGETIKADSTKTDGSWYDYASYKWANVVLVSDINRTTYKNASVGTVINEADILAYYVWIPRYSYTLWNINATGGITAAERQIAVTLQTVTDTVRNGTANGQELTHPAFWWDKNDNNVREASEELNGFWVGKFELTGDTTTPTIKPNLTSLRDQNVSSLWTTIEKFKTNTTYGINTSNLDSHMLKNMEWGAVAYLSNSQYGNRANPATGNEIYINPSDGFITGRSGNAVSQDYTTDTSGTASATLYSWNGKSCSTKSGFECTGTIQTLYGPSASTTGTIYGVYDMSGGAWEYVMGNMASSTANYNNRIMYPSYSGSAFGSYTDVTLPKRYYDIYDYGITYDDATSYMRGKLGDATKEILASISSTGSWNSDFAIFPYSTFSWFIRGGDNGRGAYAGIWCFDSVFGYAYSYYSGRAVLTLE